MPGFGFAFGFGVGGRVDASFSPLSLFAASEQGAWYDPSDLTTMYQDAAGTTAAVVGQPVGLVLDKRFGLKRGPELVTNGGFDSATGWALGTGWSISGGKLRSAGGNNLSAATFTVNAIAGKTYEVTFTIEDYVSGSVQGEFQGGGTDSGLTRNANGTYRQTILTTANRASFRFLGTGGAGLTANIDNISVREIPGNHATQSTTASKPVLRQSGALYYLEFDGVDDFLVTSAINFTATDAMSVFAGVRKLSDAALGVAVELSATLNSNNGTFYLAVPVSASPTLRFSNKGSAPSFGANANFSAAVAPNSMVLTGSGKISTDTTTLRHNGSPVASAADDLGTGNYGNYPLYIGRRGGTEAPFNGHLYGLIVRGALTADPVPTETWLNAKTGAY